jgi:hypothetical protein
MRQARKRKEEGARRPEKYRPPALPGSTANYQNLSIICRDLVFLPLEGLQKRYIVLSMTSRTKTQKE